MYLYGAQLMIRRFIIESNAYLGHDVMGFFHSEFYGSSHPNNPNYLYKFKNDPHHNWDAHDLRRAIDDLNLALRADFPQILRQVRPSLLTVCVVPRAKADCTYRRDQLLFKSTVRENALSIPGYQNGVDYIVRHTNTRTTHLKKPVQGFINDGHIPYPGIAIDTCHFAQQIRGRDILLVDDIYTKTMNIDEDMAQALFVNGARSVVFYAVGNTVRKF